MTPQTPTLLDQLQHHEQLVLPQTEAVAGSRWFEVREGQIPVLVSAPHATKHLRDGIEKMAEEYTAAIAVALSNSTGCHAIFTTRKTSEDPNWVVRGEYKECIADIVRKHGVQLVIDVHGMTNRHHMGVALGTMNGKSCPHIEVTTPFLNSGFELIAVDNLPDALPAGVRIAPGCGAEKNWNHLVVNHPRFTGGVRSQTVTRFVVEQLAVAAVQVEIASVNRIVFRAAAEDWPYEYSGNPQGIKSVVNALQALVKMA